jgi:6-phosphogluconolactonase
MSDATVVVHADGGLLAQATAARLVVRLLDAQAARGEATIVLTGGRIASDVYSALRDSPARDAVDWSQVNVWWGDERFLPAGHPDRNDVQARAVLLDALKLDHSRTHPMPASDGLTGGDPEAAAERYAEELAEAARTGGSGTADLPRFDVLLLGVGEDGHVASVFPEHPVDSGTGPVSAVRDSPKPPPLRLTLTLPAINRAEEIWLLASGAGKASAVRAALTGASPVSTALTGASPVRVPAADVRGVERTLWLIDRAAVAEMPSPPHRLR